MDYQAALRKEYKDAGKNPLQITIGDETLLVPYLYTIDAADTNQIGKDFLHDFLDINRRSAEKYRKNGETPREVIYEGLPFVVPYAERHQNLSDKEAGQLVFKRCLNKYQRAIEMTAEINRMDPEQDQIVNVSYESYFKIKQKYEQMLSERAPSKQAKAAVKGREFMRKNPKSTKKTKVGGGTSKLKNAFRNFLIVSFALGSAYVAHDKLKTAERMKELRTEIAPANPNDMRISFVEATKGKYEDKHGNIARLDSAYNDLCVVLASVEGFHAKAFDDRVGNATIGYGTTFYINEKGEDIGKVQMGDEITKDEAFLQKQRYIAKYMIPCLMQVDRPLSQKEIVGFVATGFCIGQNELKSSKFLQLLSAKDKDAWRSLSVYGKQSGVRKRTALTSAYAQGLVSTDELMSFGWKNGENIYKCSIPELYACPKDSDVPYKDSKGFCQTIYYDKVQEHIQSIIAKGVKNPVRNILPDSVVIGVEKAAKTIDFAKNINSGARPKGGR